MKLVPDIIVGATLVVVRPLTKVTKKLEGRLSATENMNGVPGAPIP